MSENFSLNRMGEMAKRSSRASSPLPWLSAGRVRVCLSFSATDGSSVAPELGVGGHVEEEVEDEDGVAMAAGKGLRFLVLDIPRSGLCGKLKTAGLRARASKIMASLFMIVQVSRHPIRCRWVVRFVLVVCFISDVVAITCS